MERGDLIPHRTDRTAAAFNAADAAIGRIDTYNWLVITSSNAFRRFLDRLRQKGMDIRDLKGVRICAIGSKTAHTIESLGVRVDMVPDEYSAEGLVSAFLDLGKGKDLSGLNILLPRAENARDLFPQKVMELGGRIDAPPRLPDSQTCETYGKRLHGSWRKGAYR